MTATAAAYLRQLRLPAAVAPRADKAVAGKQDVLSMRATRAQPPATRPTIADPQE